MSNGENNEIANGDHIEIDQISGGSVAVGRDARAIGTLINQLEETNIAGDFVERQEITNMILVVGPDGLDELTEWLANQQGINIQTVLKADMQPPPENSDRQIVEVLAAQRETAAKGVPTSPQASYRLGMLAAYRRDYDTALNYFQEAGNADPDYHDPFKATAWLQQSLAMHLLSEGDYDGALDRLAKARSAARQTDPLDADALALRGYIAKTLAQIADARQDLAGREKYYEEAANLFEHVAALKPDNASAYNGLANVYYAAGNFDKAIVSGQRAVALAPDYTAAHHDLAITYEAKWQQAPDQWQEWCVKAIAAWREAYHLAPDDPSFSAEQILQMGRRIRQLEGYCGDDKGRIKDE